MEPDIVIELKIIDQAAMPALIESLSEILVDCVIHGASLGFMLPYSRQEAQSYWREVRDAVSAGTTILVVACLNGRAVGTVQVGLATKPNQQHRADIMKLLVHSKARGLGISRMLMQQAEIEARKAERSILVLDTATGSDAEVIYPKFGWQRVGIIPFYAKFPDGRYCDATYFYKQIAPIVE